MLAAGAIDPTFGGGTGSATVGYRLSDDQVPAVVATQDDGKILVAWNGATAIGPLNAQATPPLFLARYNPDGTPDSTFGGTAHGQPAGTPAGTVAFTNDRVLQSIAKIVPIAGGKVVLAGQSQGTTTQEDAAVVRLNADGTLDTTFGGSARGYTNEPGGAAFFDFGGRTSIPGDASLDDHAYSADVSSTGEVVVTAFALQGNDVPEDKGVAILLLKTDGTLDTNFATNGKYLFSYNDTTDNSDSNTSGNVTTFSLPTVMFDAADNIIVDVLKSVQNGDTLLVTSQHSFIRVAPTGTPDITTGTAPTFPKIFSDGTEDSTFAMPNGTLLMTAQTQYGIGIVRINSDLTLDESFGDGGLAIMVPPDGSSLYLPTEQVAGTADGRFYVLAQFNKAVGDDANPIYLARFDASGIYDATFGLVKIADSGSSNITNPPTTIGPVAIALTTTSNGDAVPVVTNRFFSPAQDLIDRYDVLRVDGGAGIVLNSKGTLTVGGTSDDDTISLSIRSKDGKLIVRVGDLAQGFAPSKIKRVRVYAQNGDDTVTIGTGVKGCYISGGNGNDTITGGDGADVIEAGAGNDSILGGAGADKIAGQDGADFISGGGGNDQLDGGNDPDIINGDAGNDKLYGGLDGPDTLNGSSGTDIAEADDQDTTSGIESFLV